MVFEKAKDGVTYIQRLIRKSNDHGSFDRTECVVAVIPSYQSLDIDTYNSVVTICVNSNVCYNVSYKHGEARKSIELVIKSEIRDIKIEKVLDGKSS